METYCTRPGCPRPLNVFPDLDNRNTLKTVQQKFCTACGMPQILIGRYMPVKLLGQGGFGAAFLAIDRYTPTMRQCVVKQFQPAGDLTPDQLELAQTLFEREAEALEKLGNPHPQIPDLYAFFELSVPASGPGQPTQFFYLVQEFVDGQNIEEELEQRGRFSEDEMLEVLHEVLNILTFVHKNGSIHRDIKPSNIMRDRQGRIHLLDFGAVKQVTTVQGASPSQRSTGIYSMGFAPPEQMSGGVVYPATDLYALAVTCITLVTGKQPMELYDAFSNTWNWRGYAQIDDLVEGVLNRMLLSAPSERFQSAEEVIAALAPRLSSSGTIGMTSGMTGGMTAQPPGTSGGMTGAGASSGSGSAASPRTQAPVGSGSGQARTVPPPPPPPQRPRPAPAASPPQSTPALARPPIQSPAQSPAPAPASLRPFPVITGAAFAGFELSLIAIATLSLFGGSTLGVGILAIAIVGLLFLLIRGIIENIDLVILAVISLVLVLLGEAVFGFLLFPQSALLLTIMIPVMVGLLFLAGAIVFLLIYRILSSFL